MRIELISDDLLSTTWHVYLNEEGSGPFYRVWQDTDTESITFYTSKDNSNSQTIKTCFGAYPTGCKTITEVICKDIIQRGFGEVIINNPPWSE